MDIHGCSFYLLQEDHTLGMEGEKGRDKGQIPCGIVKVKVS